MTSHYPVEFRTCARLLESQHPLTKFCGFGSISSLVAAMRSTKAMVPRSPPLESCETQMETCLRFHVSLGTCYPHTPLVVRKVENHGTTSIQVHLQAVGVAVFCRHGKVVAKGTGKRNAGIPLPQTHLKTAASLLKGTNSVTHNNPKHHRTVSSKKAESQSLRLQPPAVPCSVEGLRESRTRWRLG